MREKILSVLALMSISQAFAQDNLAGAMQGLLSWNQK